MSRSEKAALAALLLAAALVALLGLTDAQAAVEAVIRAKFWG